MHLQFLRVFIPFLILILGWAGYSNLMEIKLRLDGVRG